MGKYKLIIKIHEIEGDCHVHEEGDTFTIDSDGQTILFDGTDKLCLYAIDSISSALPALTKESSENDWLSKDEHILQCMDPGPERGGAGTVYMKIIKSKP